MCLLEIKNVMIEKSGKQVAEETAGQIHGSQITCTCSE